jgi:pimeloyl-ACP methyl ester carboxylesterase
VKARRAVAGTVGWVLAPVPLQSIGAPTLLISAQDDRYGTCASAQYTVSRIPGARFICFAQGGHTWVGHDAEICGANVRLLHPSRKP